MSDEVLELCSRRREEADASEAPGNPPRHLGGYVTSWPAHVVEGILELLAGDRGTVDPVAFAGNNLSQAVVGVDPVAAVGLEVSIVRTGPLSLSARPFGGVSFSFQAIRFIVVLVSKVRTDPFPF